MRKSKLKRKASTKVVQLIRSSSGRHAWPQRKRWSHLLNETYAYVYQLDYSNEAKLSYRQMFEILDKTSTFKGIGPRGIHRLETMSQKGQRNSILDMFNHVKVNVDNSRRGGYRVAVTNAYHYMMKKRNEDSGVASHKVINSGNSLGDNSVLQALKQSMSK